MADGELPKPPYSPENIMNICDGLSLITQIRGLDYINADFLEIVYRIMYPQIRVEESAGIQHGLKGIYLTLIRTTMYHIPVYMSAKTRNTLVKPLYDFDMTCREYVAPAMVPLDELIPRLVGIVSNKPIPGSHYEFISLGKIKTVTTDTIKSLIKLLRFDDVELQEKLNTNLDNLSLLARFPQITENPEYGYLRDRQYMKDKQINGCCMIAIITIYDEINRRRAEEELANQDREINLDAIRQRVEEINASY